MRVLAFTVLAISVAGCSNGGTPACTEPPTCSPDGFLQHCGPNGILFVSACPDGQLCADGACRPRACTPSLFFCDGNVVDSCDSTGTLHTRTDCTSQNETCVVGPTAASCQPLACTPSTTYCAPDGSEVRKCAPDGMSFEVVESCADPLMRGNTCVGAQCRDRCTVLEAQDRSTLGCRFSGSLFDATSAISLRVGNPQLDLPATVTVSVGAASMGSVTVAPDASGTLALAAGRRDTSQAARALTVTSTVPVQAWIVAGADGRAMHPEHALSASYLVALNDAQAQSVSVTATLTPTQVTVTPSAAIVAGGAIPGTAAGQPMVRTLSRGDVLTLASTSPLAGTRVDANAPVAVELAGLATSTAPGADTLGRHFAVADDALVVARDGATVTTDRDGTLTLAAGAAAPVHAGQHLAASAPVLVVTAADVVAPFEQQRPSTFVLAGDKRMISAMPGTVTPSAGAPISLVAQSASWALGTFSVGDQLLTGAVPFFVVDDGAGPGGYGLQPLP